MRDPETGDLIGPEHVEDRDPEPVYYTYEIPDGQVTLLQVGMSDRDKQPVNNME